MLKRLLLSLAILTGGLYSAHAAGTISFNLSQNLDQYGKPLAGCKFYTIVAGTTATPQTAYQDTALTIAHSNPMTCDSAGRLPQFFLADGSIKIRLTTSGGTSVVAADNILVIGGSSGGAASSSLDATTVFSAGDLKAKYGTGTITGWVRANGRTIGSAASGASERANADAEALFEYLWDADANLSVSTGRGASALADWTANKTIALPDWRGRMLGALDDMGNSAAGRLTATYFGAAATTLGAAGGSESKVVVTANLPAYTPGGTIANGAITNAVSYPAGSLIRGGAGGTEYGGGAFGLSGGTVAVSSSQAASTFTGTAQGGVSTPVAIASPAMLTTFYLKL